MWMTAENNVENESEVVRISGLEPPTAVADQRPAGETESARDEDLQRAEEDREDQRQEGQGHLQVQLLGRGASFECALVKMKKGKGKKQPKPKFKSCKSPKKYSLKPGKYRFSVRAVLSGVADPSPATKTFKVVHVKR